MNKLIMFVMCISISNNVQAYETDFEWQECFINPGVFYGSIEYAVGGREIFSKNIVQDNVPKSWRSTDGSHHMTDKEFYWMYKVGTPEDKIKRFKKFWSMDNNNPQAIIEPFQSGMLSVGVITGNNWDAQAYPPFAIQSHDLPRARSQQVSCFGMRFQPGKLTMTADFYNEYAKWRRDNWDCLHDTTDNFLCSHLKEDIKTPGHSNYEDAYGFDQEDAEEAEFQRLDRVYQKNKEFLKNHPAYPQPQRFYMEQGIESWEKYKLKRK